MSALEGRCGGEIIQLGRLLNAIRFEGATPPRQLSRKMPFSRSAALEELNLSPNFVAALAQPPKAKLWSLDGCGKRGCKLKGQHSRREASSG